MELKFKTEDLREVVETVSHAIPEGKRSIDPALAHLTIRFVDDRLTIYGTDLEIYIEASMDVTDVKNAEDFKPFAVDGLKLKRIAASLPDEEAKLKILENKILLTSGTAKHQINPLPESPHKPIEVAGKPKTIKGISPLFKKALSIISITDHYLGAGLYIEGTDLVAMDGTRMYYYIMDDSFDGKVYIPTRAVKVLSQQEEFGLTFNDSSLYAEFNEGKVKLWSRLLMSGFSEYKSLVPEDSDRKFSVNREQLKDALKTLLPATDSSHVVVFRATKNTLELAASSDALESTNQVVCKNKTKEEISFALNGSYAIDMLNACEGREITIKQTLPGKPICVEEKNLIYLLATIN